MFGVKKAKLEHWRPALRRIRDHATGPRSIHGKDIQSCGSAPERYAFFEAETIVPGSPPSDSDPQKKLSMRMQCRIRTAVRDGN